MSRLLPLLAVLALVAATFARALAGGYVYDDLALIVANPAIAGGDLSLAVSQPLAGTSFPHWRPLTQAVLCLGHAAGGPAGIHAIALAAHLAAVAVAHRLALRLTRDGRAALFVALLFGVHPAQVESVAWCAAVNDVLWGLFALLALAAHHAERARGGAGVSWRVVAWFALALLAKETALVVPFLLLAVDTWTPVRGRRAPAWPRYARLLAVVLPWLLARALVFGDARAGFDRGPDLDLASRSAVLLPFEILGRLVAVLVWPWSPSAMRPMPVEAGASAVALAALGVLAIVAGARARSLGLAIVVVALGLPALRPGSVGEWPIADRYLYLPAFGLALALVPRVRGWRAGSGLLAVVAAGFAARAYLAIETWRDQASFVRAHLAQGEDARLLYMAGQLDLEAQPPEVGRAGQHFARAAQLAVARRFGGEDARVRLVADIATGQGWCAFLEEARRPQPDWQRAAAIFAGVLERHEGHAPAHVGLAVCLAELGDRGAAERHLLRAIDLEPNLAAAHTNLARVRARRR